MPYGVFFNKKYFHLLFTTYIAPDTSFTYNIIEKRTELMSIAQTLRALMPSVPDRDPMQCAPLTLAYLGDTLFDLYVRTWLVYVSDATAHNLHMRAISFVCAKAQAEALRRIEDMLTEEERAVFRRGRNAHMGTVPKNASIADYRAATGFEALLGFLYLKGDDARIGVLMQRAFQDAFAPLPADRKE